MLRERLKNTLNERKAGKHMYRCKDRQTDKQINKQTDSKTAGWLMDGWRNAERGGKMCSHSDWFTQII